MPHYGSLTPETFDRDDDRPRWMRYIEQEVAKGAELRARENSANLYHRDRILTTFTRDEALAAAERVSGPDGWFTDLTQYPGDEPESKETEQEAPAKMKIEDDVAEWLLSREISDRYELPGSRSVGATLNQAHKNGRVTRRKKGKRYIYRVDSDLETALNYTYQFDDDRMGDLPDGLIGVEHEVVDVEWPAEIVEDEAEWVDASELASRYRLPDARGVSTKLLWAAKRGEIQRRVVEDQKLVRVDEDLIAFLTSEYAKVAQWVGDDIPEGTGAVEDDEEPAVEESAVEESSATEPVVEDSAPEETNDAPEEPEEPAIEGPNPGVQATASNLEGFIDPLPEGGDADPFDDQDVADEVVDAAGTYMRALAHGGADLALEDLKTAREKLAAEIVRLSTVLRASDRLVGTEAVTLDDVLDQIRTDVDTPHLKAA